MYSGATSHLGAMTLRIQPGIVIYFVVMFTVGKERVLLYTIARILDTGFGVLLTLLLYVLYPSKYDKAKGVSLKTFWAEINNAFQSYKIKNRTMRKKEHENFGTDDDKNFSFIVSKIKKINISKMKKKRRLTDFFPYMVCESLFWYLTNQSFNYSSYFVLRSVTV